MAKKKSPNDNFDLFAMATTLSGQKPTENEKTILQQIAALQAQLEAARSQPPYSPSIESSSSTKPLYEMLEQHIHSLVGHWNKVSCDDEEEKEKEITQDIPTYILGSSDTADLDKRFSNSIVYKSSSAPPSIIAPQAGTYERALRDAICLEVVGLLETSSKEPEWTAPPFFGGWEALKSYTLGESKNLIQEIVDKEQARWDAAKVDVGVTGNSFQVEGFFGIIRSWFAAKDWLSLYRSQSRTLLARDGWSVDYKDDRESPEVLESHLFDTTKYYGTSELMTVITYGDGYYGTITLLRVSLAAARPLANLIMNTAMQDQVPKTILETMQLKHQIELLSKDGGMRFSKDGGQGYPYLMSVQTVTPVGEPVSWTMGDGWRKALGIEHNPEKEKDGLVATIPQMIALLHLKGSALYDLHSTQVFTFSSSDSDNSSQSRYDVSRCTKIGPGPKGRGHAGNKVTVKVLFPNDSEWAKEKILWA